MENFSLLIHQLTAFQCYLRTHRHISELSHSSMAVFFFFNTGFCFITIEIADYIHMMVWATVWLQPILQWFLKLKRPSYYLLFYYHFSSSPSPSSYSFSSSSFFSFLFLLLYSPLLPPSFSLLIFLRQGLAI
jgi:hypothetical protein